MSEQAQGAGARVNTGGPAHPFLTWQNPQGFNIGSLHEGLTIRDHFASSVDLSDINFPDLETAAKWMQCKAPDEENYVECLEFAFKLEAFMRYKKADAMLAARGH